MATQKALVATISAHEVLEKIAPAGHLQVVLGDKGLADRVTNLP